MKKQVVFVTVCVCVCYFNKYGVELYSQKQEASKNKSDLLLFSLKKYLKMYALKKKIKKSRKHCFLLLFVCYFWLFTC